MTRSSEVPNWPATITTTQLTLRPAHEDDSETYRRLWTNPAIRRFLGGPVEGERLNAYAQSFTRPPYIFSVVTNDNEEMVGSIDIDPSAHFGCREISFSFLPEHWGHGYAREAVQAAINWAFDAVPSKDPRIIAVTQRANTRSRHLLKKVGMEQFDSFVEFDAPQVAYVITPVKNPAST